VQNQITFQPTSTPSRNSRSTTPRTARNLAEFGLDRQHSRRARARKSSTERRTTISATTILTRATFSIRREPPVVPKAQSIWRDFGAPLRGARRISSPAMKDCVMFRVEPTRNVFSDAQRTSIQGVARCCKALLPDSRIERNVCRCPAFFRVGHCPVTSTRRRDQSNLSASDQCTASMLSHRLRHESTAGATIPGFGTTREGHRQVFTSAKRTSFNPTVVNEARNRGESNPYHFVPNNLTDPNTVGLGSVLGPKRPSCRAPDFELRSYFGSETVSRRGEETPRFMPVIP